MNLKESIQHNINCWKEEQRSLEGQIEFLRGRKNEIENTVETLELVLKEQENNDKTCQQS